MRCPSSMKTPTRHDLTSFSKHLSPYKTIDWHYPKILCFTHHFIYTSFICLNLQTSRNV